MEQRRNRRAVCRLHCGVMRPSRAPSVYRPKQFLLLYCLKAFFPGQGGVDFTPSPGVSHVGQVESPAPYILHTRRANLEILLRRNLSRIAILRTETEILASPSRIDLYRVVEAVLFGSLRPNRASRSELILEELVSFFGECTFEWLWYGCILSRCH